MDTLKINTVEPLTSRGQGYVQMEMDCGPAIYRGQIKVRGNSTAMGYKKPYAVKLETKAHLLGSGDKKYILLANCFDPTMMRNFLALSMAKELNIPYTPTCKYVDVYLNGEHKGLYLLTDSVMDKVEGDFLIESEQWDNPDTSVEYAISQSGRKYKVHFNNDYDIVGLLNRVENSIENNTEPLNACAKVGSLVRYYILQEFFKNADVGVSSTLYYGKDNLLRACCPWDFDLSSGNYNPEIYDQIYVEQDTANGLYAIKMYPEKMFENELFKQKLAEEYKKISPWIENIPKLVQVTLEEYKEGFENDVLDQSISYSQYQYPPFGTLKGNLDYLLDWLKRRHTFLTANFMGG